MVFAHWGTTLRFLDYSRPIPGSDKFQSPSVAQLSIKVLSEALSGLHVMCLPGPKANKICERTRVDYS